jgi:hypothetical protein
MKTLTGALVLISAAMFITYPAWGSDPAAFPSNGMDAQSLGRGGAVIATGPGVWSSFGNPATLTPEGQYILGADYIDRRDYKKNSWGLSVVDTGSAWRGAVSYYSTPEFAGFTGNMWGVSFSQTLMPSLFIGESFHMGDYEPTDSPGSEESIYTFDAGLLYKVGPGVSIGYVAHNLLPEDSDLLTQYNGFGIGFNLLGTVSFTADYEEDPVLTSENNVRTGLEFKPAQALTGRIGYQDRADGTNYYSMGITYKDSNGTLDAAWLYNDTNGKTDTVILGLSIRM